MKRYAVVGTGGRSGMFINALADGQHDSCQLVAFCDKNPARMSYYNNILAEKYQKKPIPSYAEDNFDQMIEESKPDVVIVTTIDSIHHQYIIRALELGCDAITEKPITTESTHCRAILDAVKKTKKKVRVTFNYRWMPAATLLYQLLREKCVGDIIHVGMDYMLDIHHGADYFRRWHRDKSNSGGLMVHKATHHFDLVNWWIDEIPEEVFGYGSLAFYGDKNARKRGIEAQYQRYTGENTGNDPFALDLKKSERLRKLYLEAEVHDGYLRDRNVFSEGVSIEDSMSVLVRYKNGTVLNYSLNAYLPQEGYRVTFNGTHGRIEYHELHIRNDDNPADARKRMIKLTVHPLHKKSFEVDVPKAEGGHGGADPLLQKQMFCHPSSPDPFGRDAGHEQGIISALMGIAANQSFDSGLPVRLAKLCPELPQASHFAHLV